MAKYLLWISIFVTAVTAGLGFMTKAKVQGLQDTLASTRQSEKTARDETTKTRGELKTAKEEAVAANKAAEEQKTRVTSLEGELTTAKSDADKAKEDVKTKTDRIAVLENDLIEAKKKSGPATPAADDSRVELMTAELTKIKGELAEAQRVQETLQSREKQSTEKLAEANRLVAHYQAPIEQAGITGRVIEVDRGWNYVVIDVGDRRGSTINARLLVMRGGELVARLKVTAVEPGRSVADIVPGSLARGQTVQAGDRIVFAGRATNAGAPAPASSTAAGGRTPEVSAVPAP